MNLSYYCSPPNAGFKFGTPAERDQFWASLKDNVRVGAEKIGNRTIRFHPAKMKEGFEWGMVLRNGAVSPAPTAPAAPVATPQAAPSTITTTNPFDKLATNPTRPLPGVTPPIPSQMLAAPQAETPPVATPITVAEVAEVLTPQPTTEEVNTATEIPKEQDLAAALDAVAKSDPEPNCDKRKKEWRDWKARQK